MPFLHTFVGCTGVVIEFWGIGDVTDGAGIVPLAYGLFESTFSLRELFESAQIDAWFEGLVLGMVGHFNVGKAVVGVFGGTALGVGVGTVHGCFSERGRAGAPGSFHATCTEIDYEPVTYMRRSRCIDDIGRAHDSVLDIGTCLGSDIANLHEQLRCDLPVSSYQDSCVALRQAHGVLSASRRTLAGAWFDRTLQMGKRCAAGSAVSNRDGVLVCDSPYSDPAPEDPYRNNCSNIQFDAGVPSADCGLLDTLAPNLRLDYGRSCSAGAQVTFLPRYGRPGHLVRAAP